MLASLMLAGAAACSSDPPSKVSLFSVPGGPNPPSEFYELPWPNDLKRTADGHLDLHDYPRVNVTVDRFTDALGNDIDGFGLNAAMFVRFGGPIDRATLPATPDVSLANQASIYLVNVDPASPDRGQRIPLQFRFEPKRGSTIGANWLASLPYPGFPLDEATTYALIVTNRIHAASGGPVERSPDFEEIADASVPDDAALAAAQRTYALLWAYLDEPGGDERADVVNAAVFTTQHATGLTGLLRQKVWALPAPVASGIAPTTSTQFSNTNMYDGVFPSPNFQVGEPPYLMSGAQIELGGDGLPIVQRTESVRVSFTIPRQTAAPAGGWPVVIVDTGTGSDYHSYSNTGLASTLASAGFAAISFDPVLSGMRNPMGNPAYDFFNFNNPQGPRCNTLQGAADNFSMVRLVQGLSYTAPASGPDPGGPIRFDATKVYFLGHSQGGIVGAPFLAFEPGVKAAVLSGTSALLFRVLLEKTLPFDIATAVKTYISDDPLDEFNPILALLQTWFERADPGNYGPLLARKPVVDAGGQMVPLKDIYQSEGFVDHWAPNHNIEAFATSVGGNQVYGRDGHVKQTIEGLTLRGRNILTAPVTGNMAGKTVVLAQYDELTGSDGHFVAFEVPAAQIQWSDFFVTAAATGTATLTAP